MRRSVVDLPQPDGPSSTLSVPSSNANESPSTARTLPSAVVQCLLTFSAAMADTKRSPLSRRMIASAPARADRGIQAVDGAEAWPCAGRACGFILRRPQALPRATSPASGEERRECRARIRRAHERLADEERVDAARGASPRHPPARRSRSRSRRAVPAGMRRQEIERGRERHVERAQIAVVDADERRCRERSARSSSDGVVDLDQHRHAEARARTLRAPQAARREAPRRSAGSHPRRSRAPPAT